VRAVSCAARERSVRKRVCVFEVIPHCVEPVLHAPPYRKGRPSPFRRHGDSGIGTSGGVTLMLEDLYAQIGLVMLI
jgi:hypothetical protein